MSWGKPSKRLFLFEEPRILKEIHALKSLEIASQERILADTSCIRFDKRVKKEVQNGNSIPYPCVFHWEGVDSVGGGWAF
jgi:hypothetical protein